MECTFKNVESLYAQKEYTKALDMCMQLLNDPELKKQINLKDTWLFIAKSYLMCLETPMDKKNFELSLNAFSSTCSYAKTIDEILKLEHDMLETFYEWKLNCIKKQLDTIKNQPTLNKITPFYAIFPEFIIIEMEIMIRARNCDFVNKYCDDNNIKKEDFGEKFPSLEVTNKVTDEVVESLILKCAQNIFKNTQSSIKSNADMNLDLALEFVPLALERLLVAENLAKPNKNSLPSMKCIRLKEYAKILKYELEAVMYPNGKAVSLLSDASDREKPLKMLETTYQQIKKLDPTFVIPELPSATPIIPTNSSGSQNTSSSGCYVATAVYGSYDCPEVWTLRRFRDNVLAKKLSGRIFIYLYYAISPTIVKWFGKTEWFKNMWKPILDKKIKKLNLDGLENTPYNDRQW